MKRLLILIASTIIAIFSYAQVDFTDPDGIVYGNGTTIDIYPSLVMPDYPDFFEFKSPLLFNTSTSAVSVKLEINLKQLPAGTTFAECFNGVCTNHNQEKVITTKSKNIGARESVHTACEWFYDETMVGKTCIADFTLYVNGVKDKTVTVRYINDNMPIPDYIPSVSVNNIKYDLYPNKKVAIVICGGQSYSGDFIIPKTISFNKIEYDVTGIGLGAFMGSSISSIEIPNSVTSIENSVFYGCSSLNSIEIPNSVTSIGDNAFCLCANLKSVVIPNSVEYLGNEVFNMCDNLYSVTIGNSVKNIGNNAFAWCYNLDNVTIGSSVTSIGDYAFNGCERLCSIDIPNTLTSIGEYSFYGCESLRSIIIPNSVKRISEGAFNFCKGLEAVYCYAIETPQTDPNAFLNADINKTILYVPNSSLEDYKSKSPWSGFGQICALSPAVFAIDDGETYSNASQKTFDEITYTRTFSEQLANKWNALYVPMSINVEDYLADFDFAEIYAVCPNEDTNGDGVIDGNDDNKLVVNKIKTGTTQPNKPYLIRPKQAGTYTISSADNILYPAEEKSYSCSTMTDEYIFKGLYSTANVVGSGQYYMTIDGILDYNPSVSIAVKPNRWIMEVKSKGGNSSSSRAKAMFVNVIGEDAETNCIESVGAPHNDDAIYNLNGMKMNSNNLPAGIYIKNGKKFMVK